MMLPIAVSFLLLSRWLVLLEESRNPLPYGHILSRSRNAKNSRFRDVFLKISPATAASAIAVFGLKQGRIALVSAWRDTGHF